MKRLVRHILIAATLCVGAQRAQAQSASVLVANPLEWEALAEGNNLINNEIKKQTGNQLSIAGLQSTIAAEFTKIHEWEKQYNRYLKKADGYASTLKASTSIFNDGVQIFLSLVRIRKSIGDNPQGVLASISMNNLYIETATELVGTLTLLKSAVATGGEKNMLTGAERSETLWAINDKMHSFHKKLQRLVLSIRYYTLKDVWDNATAGMIDRDNGAIARSAKARWKRIATSVQIDYDNIPD